MEFRKGKRVKKNYGLPLATAISSFALWTNSEQINFLFLWTFHFIWCMIKRLNSINRKWFELLTGIERYSVDESGSTADACRSFILMLCICDSWTCRLRSNGINCSSSFWQSFSARSAILIVSWFSSVDLFSIVANEWMNSLNEWNHANEWNFFFFTHASRL